MSFDKNYPNRKDKRKPYYGAKAVDTTCRNNGSCSYCAGNRTIQKKRVEQAAHDEAASINVYDGEVCLACLQAECDCIAEFEEMELPGILHLNEKNNQN